MSLREVALIPEPLKLTSQCLLSIAVLITVNNSQAETTQQVSAKIDRPSDAPKCYASQYSVDEYKQVQDNVISKEASSTFKITHANFGDTTTRVRIKEEHSDFDVTQARYQQNAIRLHI